MGCKSVRLAFENGKELIGDRPHRVAVKFPGILERILVMIVLVRKELYVCLFEQRVDEGVHCRLAVFECRRNAVSKGQTVQKRVAARTHAVKHRRFGEVFSDVQANFFFGFVGRMIQRKKEEIGRGEGGERRSGTGVRHMKNQVRKDGQVPRKAMLRGIETVKGYSSDFNREYRSSARGCRRNISAVDATCWLKTIKTSEH